MNKQEFSERVVFFGFIGIVLLLILGSATEGILGTNTLGSGTLPIEITDLVSRVSIRRGRNRITSQFEAGTANVTLYDQNGDWNPTNPASIYYPNLVPLRQIIIYATYATNNYFLFSGFITNYDTGFRQGNDDLSTVTLKCVDGFKLLAGSGIDTIAGSGVQLSGARVNAILDEIEWPISLRNIDAGDSTLQADPGTDRDALEALLANLLPKYRPAVRFAMLTGLRRANVLGLRWDAVNLEAATAKVAPEDAKGGKQIVVPLNEAAMALLKAGYSRFVRPVA